MKIISVFVTLCAIALNLSFGAASRDYRYPHDLNNNRIPIRDHIGTRNGETFLNVNFDTAHTYPHAPFAPKGPIREHTVESHSTNHTRRGNVKCGQPPRAPFAPNGDCGNRTDASTVTVSPVFHIRRPHGPHSYRLNPPTGPGGSVDVSGRTPKRPHGPDDIVVEKRDAAPAEENEIFYYDTFSHELVEEKDKTMANIADVWKDCNDQFRLPWGKALKFFDNSAKMEPDMSEKYLVDCTLRGMGVMMNDSFQEEEYLLQIHKLLLSYATFDINVQSKEVKDLAWDAIGRQLMERFSQNENCYPIGSRLKEAVKLDTMNVNIPDKLKWIASYQIPDICMELLKSYEMAVRECKNVKAPTGQSYETAWLIVQCITEGNQNRMFDAPFYPGVLYTATLKVPRT